MRALRCAVAAGVTVLAVAGCGGPAPAPAPVPPPTSAPAATGLPPRPMTLSIEGVDPCSLVTDAQLATLRPGLVSTGAVQADGFVHGMSCSWEEYLRGPDETWGVVLATSPGAEFALGKDPMRLVQGFAATSTTAMGTDPRWYCTMFVDIAPGQSLKTDYENARRDFPGMNHELACAKAQKLAEYMLTALKARQPG